MNDQIHIFSGRFDSEAEARKYSQEQWTEYSPFEESTEEEIKEWEVKNPEWHLRDDLKLSDLDASFIGTGYGSNVIDQTLPLLEKEEEKKKIKEAIPSTHNTIVLIYGEALETPDVKLFSTPKLIYLGKFAAKSD